MENNATTTDLKTILPVNRRSKSTLPALNGRWGMSPLTAEMMWSAVVAKTVSFNVYMPDRAIPELDTSATMTRQNSKRRIGSS